MSAYSDYRVTHDEADLASFKQECEAGERDYFDELVELEEEE